MGKVFITGPGTQQALNKHLPIYDCFCCQGGAGHGEAPQPSTDPVLGSLCR